MAGHTRDGLFACWVDFGEDNLVQLRQGIGKVAVEVSCASVKVWLENTNNATTGIDLTDALDAGSDFFGVVGIVA